MDRLKQMRWSFSKENFGKHDMEQTIQSPRKAWKNCPANAQGTTSSNEKRHAVPEAIVGVSSQVFLRPRECLKNFHGFARWSALLCTTRLVPAAAWYWRGPLLHYHQRNRSQAWCLETKSGTADNGDQIWSYVFINCSEWHQNTENKAWNRSIKGYGQLKRTSPNVLIRTFPSMHLNLFRVKE